MAETLKYGVGFFSTMTLLRGTVAGHSLVNAGLSEFTAGHFESTAGCPESNVGYPESNAERSKSYEGHPQFNA